MGCDTGKASSASGGTRSPELSTNQNTTAASACFLPGSAVSQEAVANFETIMCVNQKMLLKMLSFVKNFRNQSLT